MNDLRTIYSDLRPNVIGKLIGAIVVAAAIVLVGFYTYDAGMWKSLPPQPVPYKDLPSPGLPVLPKT